MEQTELIALIVRCVIEELDRQGLLDRLQSPSSTGQTGASAALRASVRPAPTTEIAPLIENQTGDPPPSQPTKRLLITEERLLQWAGTHRERIWSIPTDAMVTPLARDRARELGIDIVINQTGTA